MGSKRPEQIHKDLLATDSKTRTERGLESRRVAVFIGPDDDPAAEQRAAPVIRALEEAGARIHVLKTGKGDNDDWHGARYAALVVVDDGSSAFSGDTRLVQLAREFLVSDKPIAAIGGGLWALLKAGGAAGRSVAAHGLLRIALEGAGATCVNEPIHVDEALITARADANLDEFARRVVREFSNQLEERELDEMSELSFPASDPPAITPATIGRVAPDRETDSRP